MGEKLTSLGMDAQQLRRPIHCETCFFDRLRGGQMEEKWVKKMQCQLILLEDLQMEVTYAQSLFFMDRSLQIKKTSELTHTHLCIMG